LITNPMTDHKSLQPRTEVNVLGDWDGPSPYGVNITWRQYTNQLIGEVLQQNFIAERLQALGLLRIQNEPYVVEDMRGYNAASYVMALTYDEWDALLDLIPG